MISRKKLRSTLYAKKEDTITGSGIATVEPDEQPTQVNPLNKKMTEKKLMDKIKEVRISENEGSKSKMLEERLKKFANLKLI